MSKSPELGISQDILKIKQIYLPVAGFHQILTPPVQIFTRLPLAPNGMLTVYKSHSVLSSHLSTCMLVQGFVRLMQPGEESGTTHKESELRSCQDKLLIMKAYKAIPAMQGERLQKPVHPAHGGKATNTQ